MPLFWRTLTNQFLKTFTLAIMAFTLLLIVLRAHEVASLATSGAPLKILLQFIFYQIPYILPVAIPISVLISSYLLMQKLSHEKELIALFAVGISLKKILYPILFIAFILSCLNFYITSEVATNAHLATKKLVQNLSAVNPLTVLNKSQLIKRKDCQIKYSKGKAGSKCKNLIVGLRQQKDSRTLLLFAKELDVEDQQIKAKHLTLITSIATKENGFDHVILENQSETLTPSYEFTHLLKKNPWRLCPDHLNMPLLIAKIKEIKKEPPSKNRELNLSKSYTEIARRVQLGFFPLAFSLLGVSFGLEIGRKKSKKALILTVSLAALAFTCFFLGKTLSNTFYASVTIYFTPIILLLFFSIKQLYNIEKGIDS